MNPAPQIQWTVYQENIAILGMQGSGKTTHAKKLLDSIFNIPRLIISPQNTMGNYGNYGMPISSISEIENGKAMLWTGDFGKSTIERIANTIMARCSNMVIVIDDIHEYCSKQKMPDNLNRLIQSGRNRGICGIYISPSANLVNNYILQSCQHIFSFKMTLESQIEWLEKNYFGVDAQLLLPKDRRQRQPIIQSEFEVLPKFSYLYRYHTDTQNQLFIGSENGQ